MNEIIQLPPGDWGECGFRWETEDMPGPHVCIKNPGHVSDATDDDHKCCCGHNTWNSNGKNPPPPDRLG